MLERLDELPGQMRQTEPAAQPAAAGSDQRQLHLLPEAGAKRGAEMADRIGEADFDAPGAGIDLALEDALGQGLLQPPPRRVLTWAMNRA